jgi:hypothetical protein
MLAWLEKSSEWVRTLAYCGAALLAVGCGDDADAAGTGAYYLTGNAYDATTAKPAKDVQLTLFSGRSTKRGKTQADGSYTIGPISAGTSYRLRAEGTDMSSFEFTGLSLPLLDSPGDRSLIGDIPLYPKDKETPAFKIRLSTADPRVPTDGVRATVRFVPIVVGSDPSLAATLGVSSSSADVTGEYVQPMDALPNEMASDAPTYRAVTDNDALEIPTGALSWGATYNVKIDPGPAFATVQFLLTPVKDDDILVVLQPLSPPGQTQLPSTYQQYFTGRVYDGVSLERLSDYTMRLEYFDRVLGATVSPDGRYVVGPLLPNADYSIVIESDDYRSFLSHNARITTNNTTPPLTSTYYDAFLYPKDVRAPAVSARIGLRDSTTRPSGSVRFAPRDGSALFDEDSDTPAGVNRQVWSNDDDLQQRVIVRDFSDGVVELAEGDLVLGVEYQVSVYGVKDYALLKHAPFRAGIDTNPYFLLDPLAEPPLSVVAVSSNDAEPSTDGHVEFRFNHDISLYPRVSRDTLLRQLNDDFSIDSPDEDGDSMRNTLNDTNGMTVIAPMYRGVSFEISGDRLILNWDRGAGLKDTDQGELINSVTYGGLSGIEIYTGTLPNSPPSSLSALIGSNQISVQLVAL